MRVLVICQPGKVMLVGQGGLISGIVEGPQNTAGNPYILFGPIIRSLFGFDPLDCILTVATVTSGDLERMEK